MRSLELSDELRMVLPEKLEASGDEGRASVLRLLLDRSAVKELEDRPVVSPPCEYDDISVSWVIFVNDPALSIARITTLRTCSLLECISRYPVCEEGGGCRLFQGVGIGSKSLNMTAPYPPRLCVITKIMLPPLPVDYVLKIGKT